MNTNNKPLYRILTIVLSLSLVVAALSVPASASTYEERWTNVLDYATVNNTGSNAFGVTSGSEIPFALPGDTIIQDIDIVFRSNRDITSVKVVRDDDVQFSLKIVRIGSNLYRASGQLGGYSFDSLNIVLSFNSGTVAYGEFLQLHISSQTVDFYNLDATINKSPYVSGPSSHPAGGDTTVFHFTDTGEWSIGFTVTDWKKVDYLYFAFSSQNIVIGSVTAYVGDRSIPVNIVNYNGDPEGSYSNMITGCIDLCGVDRDGANPLDISIIGTCYNTAGSQLWLSWLNGSIKVDDSSIFALIWNSIKSGFNSVVSWFSSLQSSLITQARATRDRMVAGFENVVSKLDEFINGSEEQQQAANDFKENAGDQSSAISGAVDAMDVNRSEVNTDVSVQGITGGLDFGHFNVAMLTVTSSGTVNQILIMTAALMLVSYVLFGKKI